ncbi:MAG: tetratricopeptide repeat protein [Gemmataceae bacterium]
MGTTTAPTTPENRPVTMAQLWQAPVFVLGLAALAAVWFCRPLWPDCAARRIDADLATARQLLSGREGDADQALKLAQRALEACESAPDRTGEVALLAGTACIRLAEKADPVRSSEHWQKAREYLGQALAQADNLESDSKAQLNYRLAKVGYHTNEPLPAVIAKLEETVPSCDARAEGYRLLTDAYLKLPQPDLTRAIAANQKLRDVAEASEAELTQAKLQGGEILLRMGKTEEARRSLEKIGEHSAPAMVVKARLLRARAYQDEKQWGEATRLYNAALADSRAPVSDPASIYFNLGLCYRNLEQPQEAAKAWQECVRLARGSEGVAAALVLAELRLNEQALEPALEVLTLVAARLGKPAESKATPQDLTRAREVFERALTIFRQASRHDLASKTLEAYTPLAPPRRALMLQGELASEWAKAKLDAPRLTPEIEKQAAELHRTAAEAYAKVAATPGLSLTEQGETLWNAAQNFLAGHQEARATAALEQVVKLNLEPARLGEAWFRLAEVYRGARKSEAAQAAYSKCMEFDTKFAYRARHALALGRLETGDLDEAEAALVFNLKMLRWESDPEALSQSLFTLGNLLYQRRDYRRVVRYLEDALGRFKDNPEVTRARYQLADAYRQIAAQENQSFLLGENMSPEARAHFQKEHRRWLQKAAEEFATLERFLDSPEGKEHLTPDLRSQVPFITAKCWFNLGQYDKALVIYEKLIDRHPGKAEGLDALGGAVSCHAGLGQVDKVKQRLLQIKTALPQMPDEVRKPWEDWLVEAIKPLSEL